jgi:hypothetical protein
MSEPILLLRPSETYSPHLHHEYPLSASGPLEPGTINGLSEPFASLRVHEERKSHTSYQQTQSKFPAISASPSSSRPASRSAKKHWACSWEGCNKSYTKACRLAEHERSHSGEVSRLFYLRLLLNSQPEEALRLRGVL